MRVTVEYAAQLKQAAGTGREVLDVANDSGLEDVVREVAARHGARLQHLLLDEQGQLQRSVLLFLGDQQVRWNSPAPLYDGATLTILTPISGG